MYVRMYVCMYVCIYVWSPPPRPATHDSDVLLWLLSSWSWFVSSCSLLGLGLSSLVLGLFLFKNNQTPITKNKELKPRAQRTKKTQGHPSKTEAKTTKNQTNARTFKKNQSQYNRKQKT